MNKAEAQREHEREEWERKQEAWRAKIIGSPVEMGLAINLASDETRMKIMRLIANLTDAGLELKADQSHAFFRPIIDDRSFTDLSYQTLDMAVELAEAVKQAIEEYISE